MTRATGRAIGLEYEIGFPASLETTAKQLSAATGISVQASGYTHRGIGHWKIVTDRSVNVEGKHGAELVSPKLEGFDVLREVQKMLDAIGRLPGHPKVNATAGHHVHFDGSKNMTLDDVKKIAASFFVHEEAFDVLLPPSRQGDKNQYVRSHRVHMGCDDATAIQRIRSARDFDALNETFCPDCEGRVPVTRYYKLNLTNLSTAYVERGREAIKTIEFRQHSATWEASKSIAWIRLLECFVEKTRRQSYVTPLPAYYTPAQTLKHLFQSIDLPQELIQFWWYRAVELDEERTRRGETPRVMRINTAERGLPPG